MNHKNQPIRFLHFPKTAGTTLTSALSRIYGRKHMFAFTGDADKDRSRLMNIDLSVRSDIRLFVGHSMYETGIPEIERARTVVMLREPIDRVKSFIQHVAVGKSSYLAEYARSGDFSIDGFLGSGNGELSNLQTKMLINDDFPDSGNRIKELGDEAAIELAKSRLFEKAASFGLQEDFDAGWVAIWNSIGRRPPLYSYLNRKKPGGKLEFNESQIEKIKALNSLDMNLYKAAKEEFLRRRASGEIDGGDVKKFQKSQRGWRGKLFSFAWNTARNVVSKDRLN